MTKRHRAWIFATGATVVCVLPLWRSLWTSAPWARTRKGTSRDDGHTDPAHAVLAAERGRDIRSLSVHPNGVDWLFVECAQSGDNRCDVMRYQLDSGRLYRYALPPAYSYTYARYSPKGNFIVMSRMPVYGDTEDELRRSLHDLQIVLMRADGSAFEVVPVAPGNKLSPFMSPDESRIAFWHSERLVPPGRRVRLLEFDIWEFDRRGMHEQPFAGIFKFVEGGQAQYISDDEILLESFGPSGLFSRYHEIYAGSAIYRMRRGMRWCRSPLCSTE